MPPDRPDKHSGPPKRHRRSRSINMPPSSEVVAFSGPLEPENSRSGKHDRHEKETQVEGPSKRQKLTRVSEPPTRKDTTMTPKTKRKQSRSRVNHHKASRTSKHQDLKDRISTLERALEAHEDTNREQQEDLEWHSKEVKRLEQLCNEQTEDVREQKKMVKTARQDNENLATGVEALQRSCQDKDEVIATLKRDLDDSKGQSASLEKSLVEIHLTMKSKDELIAAKQNELDDSKHRFASLTESLGKAKFTITDKEKVIDALEKALLDSKGQSAFLEESLADMRIALRASFKGKDELKVTMQKDLDSIRHRASILEKSLGEKERALKTAEREQSDSRKELALRDEKLSSTELDRDQTKAALEKAQTDAEALHIINEGNGHRNHNLRSREKKVKDALQSLQTEHADRISEFEAREDAQNQMVTNLQLKLNEYRQQSQRYNYKEPDEKIKEDFTNLESNIRQFVDQHARPVLNATDQELKTVWPNWSPDLRKFLASPLLCNQILEAYVWECLLARVFTPGSEIWAGDFGQSLDKTLRMAAEETKDTRFDSDLYIDYQYLRLSSSCFISRLNGPADFRPKYFDADVKTMVTKLVKLTELHEITGTMMDDAMGIFEEARKLEIQLRMLKATYTLRMDKPVPSTECQKYGFEFSDEDMDDRSPNRSGKTVEEARSVDFIMCPGLFKRGNNSGAKYEIETCLVKMGVVCNTSELFKKSGQATSVQPVSTRASQPSYTGEVKQKNGVSTTRSRAFSTANRAKRGSSVSNPFQIKGEEAEAQQDVDLVSTPGPASGTRSQGLPKADSNVHGGNFSANPRKGHAAPMGAAKRRGSGSSAKKSRQSKGYEPDEEYRP